MSTFTSALGHATTACRMCGSGALERYLDLGHQPPADAFRRAERLAEPVIAFPLEVYVCTACGLSQLGYVAAAELLYQDEYPYESSTTTTGRGHFRALAADAVQRLGLARGDLAVDIGSNVGVLLAAFRDQGLRVVGVDPAEELAAAATASGIPTRADFWGDAAAAAVLREHGPARVITGSNVFAHVDDLDAFVRSVDRLLAPGGALVIESPHLVPLIEGLEYDTIYHEHLSYLSVAPLRAFFARHGMRLFDVQAQAIHGGSMRLFVDRGERPVDARAVDGFLARERTAGVHDPARLHAFAARVAAQRRALRTLLQDLQRAGKRTVAVSAPAKGMTLLNYCGLGRDDLAFVTERAERKIGRFTPGGQIPVLPDAALLEQRPDFGLLLAWNFAEEIMRNLSAFADGGGAFIIPIPEPTIVRAGGRRRP